MLNPSLQRDRSSQPVKGSDANGHDVAWVPSNQREPVRSHDWLAGTGHSDEDVAGQLPDVGPAQTRAERSGSDIDYPIELKIGLPVAGADGERPGNTGA